MSQQTKFVLLRNLSQSVLLLIVFFITSCASTGVHSDKCRALLLQHQLANDLENRGIQVITVGDEVTLILPTDKFFYSGSNHLLKESFLTKTENSFEDFFDPTSSTLRDYSDLQMIVAFLNAYPTEDIQVKGFTDTAGDYQRNLALSRDRAQKIADYLVYHGLNTRLISASGYGCHDKYGFDHVEIFFRLPPPDNVFH